MSTKNIALDTEVYKKLAGFKRDSESFSKAVNRMLNRIQTEHTGATILQQLEDIAELSEEEARGMRKVIQQARRREKWKEHDLG